MAPTVLMSWSLAPILLLFIFHRAGRIDSPAAITFALRSLMMGLISSAVVFFGMESHARKTLIPFFFPRGHLYQIQETAHLPIYRRILAFYRVGSLIPLANIVVTLFILHWQVNPEAVDARTYGRGVLFFSLMVFFLFFLSSGYMSRRVARSISDPLDDLIHTLRKLKDGDYTTRTQVVSNDEVGRVGDAANRMIQGLQEREMIRDTFGKYVDPAVRDEIISQRIPLDGDIKEVSILFADLRGFTAMGESTHPKEMVRRLNLYFGEMEKSVRNHGGLVLQFLGDEIYAVFGAPVPCKDHADRAIHAALDMQHRREKLNEKFREQGRPPLFHGIGIHSGTVVAANIGSPNRQSYMLVGDTVNLASRLQGETRKFKAEIILSNDTRNHLGDPQILSRFIRDSVQVRGRQVETEIYYLPLIKTP